MRYFERQALSPSIQAQLDKKTSTNWNSLTDAQSKEIRAKLYVSQLAICAYCECRIINSPTESHIEHFVERHDDNTMVFDYNNMLLSCEGDRQPIEKPEHPTTTAYRRANISCGFGKEKSRHKDINGKEIEIDYNLLLNPTHNVSTLFSYIDGVVEPSNICSIEQSNQVEYTIKRLNLGAFRLENERIRRIRAIRNQLLDLPTSEQKPFIQSLFDEGKNDLEPFISTIKDNFAFLLA
jgi:uncharacterized protein (TIGR02646 family)